MLNTNLVYFNFYKKFCLTLLSGIISIFSASLVSAQTINSYEDFKLNCSKEAFYYNVQSPDCERYYTVENTPNFDEKSGMNRQFKQFYLQQLEVFKTALKLADEAHSIEQLQQARNYLNKTIVQLEKIPIDTEIHSSVWQTLTDAKLHLNNIDSWIGKETKAAEQIKQVKLLMSAASQTKTATNLSDYQAAKAKWENVQQRLELIPLGLFYMDDVKTLQERVSEQVNSIQAQINRIMAQEQRHQEQVVQR